MQVSAMIALRRIVTRIHGAVFEGNTHMPHNLYSAQHTSPLTRRFSSASSSSAETQQNYGGPPFHVIKELEQQLESWRNTLPDRLQWSDNHRDDSDYPSGYSLGSVPHESQFPVPPGGNTSQYMSKSAVAMSTAQLRSRYYYSKFMLYRPYVYKVLHFPDQLSEEDEHYASVCLQASLLWPISMDPHKGRKRLIPYLFAWTQNFFGILLILRMTTENRILRNIVNKYNLPAEIDQTVLLLLDWFRDMRQVDGIAEWAWRILDRLYADVLSAR
jgi:hypothetical protein